MIIFLATKIISQLAKKNNQLSVAVVPSVCEADTVIGNATNPFSYSPSGLFLPVLCDLAMYMQKYLKITHTRRINAIVSKGLRCQLTWLYHKSFVAAISVVNGYFSLLYLEQYCIKLRLWVLVYRVKTTFLMLDLI